MSLGPITHVLFDLDGVLLDTERLYTQAIDSIAARFGKTYDWSVKRLAMGRDARIASQIIIDRLGLPLTAEAFLAERDPLLEVLFARTEELPGAERFVRLLNERGVPMAVATSSDRHLFELKARPHAWFSLFGAVVCGDDPRVAAKKPAPDIFLTAARDLGADPARCLVFEDSVAGVEAARAAGMRVVALPDAALGRDGFGVVHGFVGSWAEATLELLA